MPNTNTNTKTDWKKNELGVLWKRESKGGEKYLTGTLKFADAVKPGQEVQVIIFSNKNKKMDNHPDLRVYVSEKTGAATNTAPKTAVKASAPVAQPTEEAPTAESNDLL